MRLLVAVKRVPDPYGRVRLSDDGAHLDTSEARTVVNPYDEIALDSADALRRAGAAEESVAVVVAPARTAAGGYEETLRAALARGADRGLLVTVEGAPLSPQTVALALADAARREEASLVLCGRQGADSDDGQTGARVAGLLGWPLLTAAGSVAVEGGRVRVTRETDEGTETVEADLPAVVTCDLRGRDPRPLPLPSILKAKGKPLAHAACAPAPSATPPPRVLGYALPPSRAACRMVGSVDELVAALAHRESGGVDDGTTSFSLPESDRFVVGTESEADALAWIAGRRGWPMVRNVVAAEATPGGGLRVIHTVHAGRFRRVAEAAGGEGGAPVVLIVPAGAQTKAQRERVAALLADERPLPGERVSLERHAGAAGRPDLGTARVVVAGGRPLRDPETFERIAGGLADALGGAAAASGGAVNAGIAPSWMLIGQTGRTVAPDLYIALGISGSDQHVAGMQGAKTIVAVNTDADAPIFRVADLGLVADLHSVVPEWIAKKAK